MTFIQAFRIFLESVGPEAILAICPRLFSSERAAEIFIEFFDHEELSNMNTPRPQPIELLTNLETSIS